MVVLDGLNAPSCRAGMKIFFEDLARITSAKLIWGGPAPTSVRRTITKDLKECMELIRGVRSQLHPLESVMRTDGWTHTPTHRHYFGAEFDFLTPDWQPRMVAFALHETHSQQDLLEKESAQSARTIALVAAKAWRTMCTRVTSAVLHDMPCIGISDNQGWP